MSIQPNGPARIHETAIVHDSVVMGEGCVIHPFVVIAQGVTLGDGVEVFPGTVIGKPPSGAGATAREPTFQRRTLIGSGCAIGPNSVIYYDVQVGANCLIGDGASIREGCRIGRNVIVSRCVTLNYEAAIGDNTKIMDNTHLTGKIVIGKNVFIGPGVMTANDNDLGRTGYANDLLMAPVIEDDAVIGLGASLLPGVTVGRGSTVAGQSLVAHDVPPGILVMGIPARPRGAAGNRLDRRD